MAKHTPPPTSRPYRWQGSPEFRAMAREAIKKFNAGPKCGAARKSDGQPCEQPALENGRCRFHGGRVPRGKNWHKHQWPTKDGPSAVKRLVDKQRQIDRQAEARGKRLAAMTPEERRRHNEWQRTHRPGSAAKRQIAREERQTARHIQEMMDAPPATSPELERLGQEIERLQAVKLERALRTLFD